MVWKPDKGHCCMFLLTLCTLRLKSVDRVFVAFVAGNFHIVCLTTCRLVADHRVTEPSSDLATAIVCLQFNDRIRINRPRQPDPTPSTKEESTHAFKRVSIGICKPTQIIDVWLKCIFYDPRLATLDFIPSTKT